MQHASTLTRMLAASLLALGLHAAQAADYPAPVEADWTARDFRFHTGEVMPALRIHYTTVGKPGGQPVLILHGTADAATKPQGSQYFFDHAGSVDKTLQLYEGHVHDLLNDIGRERVMSDVANWLERRLA